MNYITIQTISGNIVTFTIGNDGFKRFKIWLNGNLFSSRKFNVLPGQSKKGYTDPMFFFHNGAIARKDIDTVKWEDKYIGKNHIPNIFVKMLDQTKNLSSNLASNPKEGQVVH